MIATLSQRIITSQEQGVEQWCTLTLDIPGLRAQFKKDLNSYHVRNNMQRSIWHFKKEREAEGVAGVHDTAATADAEVDIVDEPLDVSVLGAPCGGESKATGSGSAGTSTGSDETVVVEPSDLQRAESPVEEELDGFRFHGHDKVLKIRYHPSTPAINVAIEG